MKKIIFCFLTALLFILIACSAPLEGFGVKPSAIENVTLSGEDGSLTVTWPHTDLADSYKVFWNDSETIPIEPYAVANRTSITIPNLLNDVTYYVWVVPFNNLGEQTPKMVFSGIIPLSEPKDVTSEKTTGDTVKVSWQPVVLADEYEVFYKTSPDQPAISDTPDKTVSVSSAVLSGLDQPDYYIWIKAKNSRGKSAFSGMIQDSFALSVPQGIASEKITADTINVNWQPVALADEYEIFCRTNQVQPALSDTPDKIVSVNSAVFSDLDQPDYYIWIKAKSSRGKSALSDRIQNSFVVSNFMVSSMNENGISLEWKAMNEARGYNVYRSTDENETYSKIHTGIINDTKFIDTDITRFTTYYYKVSATIGGIEAIQSNPVSAVYGILIPGSGVAAKLAWLQSNAASDTLYGIEVTDNEYLVPQKLSYTGKNGIVIIMNGIGAMRTINLSAGGSLFTIDSNVTLILDNNITLNGRSGNTASLITISQGGTMVMNAGSKITGNSITSSSVIGGGVYVAGTFTMNGGEISGNTISGVQGGGVFVLGTFTMNGGTISSNTSSSSGGGVCVNGTFTMNDGKISGNSSSSGGGVGIYEGMFFMNGGEITANSASSIGGGVYVYSGYSAVNDGAFIMSGGVIYGSNATASIRNTAKSNGAALYLYLNGLAKYGTYSGGIFYKSGDLTVTNDTIRIVNGNWQKN